MNKNRFLFLAIISLMPTLSIAERHSYTIIGSFSCENWLKESENFNKIGSMPFASLAQKRWALGYLSGANSALSQDMLRNIDSETIFLWVDKECNKTPDEQVTGVLDKLIIKLLK